MEWQKIKSHNDNSSDYGKNKDQETYNKQKRRILEMKYES